MKRRSAWPTAWRWLVTLVHGALVLIAAGSTAMVLPADAHADTGSGQGCRRRLHQRPAGHQPRRGQLHRRHVPVDAVEEPNINPWQTIDVMNSNGTQNTTSSSTGGVVGEPLFENPRTCPTGRST